MIRCSMECDFSVRDTARRLGTRFRLNSAVTAGAQARASHSADALMRSNREVADDGKRADGSAPRPAPPDAVRHCARVLQNRD